MHPAATGREHHGDATTERPAADHRDRALVHIAGKDVGHGPHVRPPSLLIQSAEAPETSTLSSTPSTGSCSSGRRSAVKHRLRKTAHAHRRLPDGPVGQRLVRSSCGPPPSRAALRAEPGAGGTGTGTAERSRAALISSTAGSGSRSYPSLPNVPCREAHGLTGRSRYAVAKGGTPTTEPRLPAARPRSGCFCS